jgi:hypothetical protein
MTQDQRLTELSGTVLGAVNLATTDSGKPLCRPVVIEVKDGGVWREITGVLKDYSAEWLLALDAGWPRIVEAAIPPTEKCDLREAGARLRREASELVIENLQPKSIELIEWITPEGRFRLATARSRRMSLPSGNPRGGARRRGASEGAGVFAGRLDCATRFRAGAAFGPSKRIRGFSRLAPAQGTFGAAARMRSQSHRRHGNLILHKLNKRMRDV